jgi:hypothetical protein
MKRKRNYTSWAAALATAAELSRRCYDVTITFGNTPKVDLLGAIPGGKAFKVQVKGISYPNAFFVQKDFFEMETQEDLFLVVVLVPEPEQHQPFRFFILKHAEAKEAYASMPTKRKDGTPYKDGCDGLTWGAVKPHQDRWDKFPVLTKKETA